MATNNKLLYEAPSTMIRVVRAKGLICTSSVSGSINLGGWNVVSGDAWSGGAGAGDGSGMGGWTDNGGDAWL